MSIDEGSDCSLNSILSIILYYLDDQLDLKHINLGMPKLFNFDSVAICKEIVK